MRLVSEERLRELLAALPGTPRVVAAGNFGTPWRALAALDAAVPEYRLFMLNAQPGISVQAEQIISQVAHPRVRDELREAGRALGFRV